MQAYYNSLGPQNMRPAPIAQNKLACPQALAATQGQRWIIIELENTSDSDQKVELFDASGAKEIKEDGTLPSGVVIRGISTPYQILMNKLASLNQYCISGFKAETPTEDADQLKEVVSIYKDIDLSNSVNLEKEIYMSTYRSPMNQQDNIIDVLEGFYLSLNTTFQFNLRAGKTITFSFLIGGGVQQG